MSPLWGRHRNRRAGGDGRVDLEVQLNLHMLARCQHTGQPCQHDVITLWREDNLLPRGQGQGCKRPHSDGTIINLDGMQLALRGGIGRD